MGIDGIGPVNYGTPASKQLKFRANVERGDTVAEDVSTLYLNTVQDGKSVANTELGAVVSGHAVKGRDGLEGDSTKAYETFRIDLPNIHDIMLISPDMLRHVSLVTRKGDSYIVVGFPEGNSGFYAELGDSEVKAISNLRPVHTRIGGRDFRGISVELQLNSDTLHLHNIMADSLRTIRAWRKRNKGSDYYERKFILSEARAKFPELANNESIKVTYSPENSTLKLSKSTLDGKYTYKVKLYPVEGYRKVGNDIKLKVNGDKLRLEMLSDYPVIKPLKREEIFSKETLNWLTNFKNRFPEIKPTIDKIERTLEFLSTSRKLLAGSWRYLTYFGRDTALTLLMLEPVVSRKLLRIGLQSLIDRVNDIGEVPHEEDIGEQAVLDNLKGLLRTEGSSIFNLKRRLKELDKPVYDYKMVDESFMLPLLLIRYLRADDVVTNDKVNFLWMNNLRGESNLNTTLRNANLILSSAERYYLTHNSQDMIHLKDGQVVGDWRDSKVGLAGGRYPYSVNVGLVRFSLEALRDVLYHLRNLIGDSKLEIIIDELKLDKVAYYIKHPDKLEGLIKAWRDTEKAFKVKLSPDEIRNRVIAYIESDKVTPQEREAYLNQLIDKGVTLRDFLYKGVTPPVLRDGIEFPALSLDKDGKPIPVMHIDFSFPVYNGVLAPNELEKLLKLIELPFPLGLRTPVGILSTNPVLTGNPEIISSLDSKAYHGTVVWAWLNVMLGLGLIKHLHAYHDREDVPETLRKRINDTLTYIIGFALNPKYKEYLNNELWAYEVREGAFQPAPYGGGEATNESNTIQLWNTSWLALLKESDEIGMLKRGSGK